MDEKTYARMMEEAFLASVTWVSPGDFILTKIEEQTLLKVIKEEDCAQHLMEALAIEPLSLPIHHILSLPVLDRAKSASQILGLAPETSDETVNRMRSYRRIIATIM